MEQRAWTSDGKLRDAAYKGLQEVQDNSDVYRFCFCVGDMPPH
jgi:bifunctional non-homologous end joining protein LigD